MATVTKENSGVSTEKISIQLNKEDYYPEFEKSLKTYSKSATLPGFRKGMVPMGHVKKMFGQEVYRDQVVKSVEKQLTDFLQKENIRFFGQPLPTAANTETFLQLDMNNPAEYNFEFEVGVRPDFKVADLAGAKIEKAKIKADENFLNEEIERLRKRHGVVTEPETITRDEDILNLSFYELDENGQHKEGVEKHENSLLLKYFSEAVRPQLNGLKVGDKLTIDLNEAFDAEEKDWVINDLKLEKGLETYPKYEIVIDKIGFMEPANLDNSFFEVVYPGKGIEDEAAFRAQLGSEIETHFGNEAQTQVNDNIYHYLMDNTAIAFPEEFLRRWIKEGGEEAKTAEEVEKEFPSFINSLKWTLISNNLAEEAKVQVTDDDLRAHAKAQMMQYMGVNALDETPPWLESYVDRMMQDEKFTERAYHDILGRKVFDYANTQVKNFEEKEMSWEDFQKTRHHHHH